MMAVMPGRMRHFSSAAVHWAAVVGGSVRRSAPNTSPYSHAPTGSDSRICISVSINFILLSRLFHQSATLWPSAAKLASAAASRPHATPQSASVSATVASTRSALRTLMRPCRPVFSAENTVRTRRKKLPKGSRNAPARPSSKTRLPLYPWASIPHRASTYQTAKMCHAIHCHVPSGSGW